MISRRIRTAALIGAGCTLMACGPARDDNNNGTGDGGVKCIGTACDDAGVVDAGNGGVELTLVDLVTSPPGRDTPVKVNNLIVHSVENTFTGSQGDVEAGWWASDETGAAGIWLEKPLSGGGTYLPVVGDKINVEGYYQASTSFFDNRTGQRRGITRLSVQPRTPMVITRTAQGQTPAAYAEVVSGTFGDADAGNYRPNPEYASRKVHIAGPLTITTGAPPALRVVDVKNATNTLGFGFEVSGGILVNDFKTFSGCNWGKAARDGGTIVFANGIQGVWDTYTHSPCADGGFSNNCFPSLPGRVPGTTRPNDGGENFFTYVLYPQSCADLPGAYQ